MTQRTYEITDDDLGLARFVFDDGEIVVDILEAGEALANIERIHDAAREEHNQAQASLPEDQQIPYMGIADAVRAWIASRWPVSISRKAAFRFQAAIVEALLSEKKDTGSTANLPSSMESIPAAGRKSRNGRGRKTSRQSGR